jgi:hypothetical protein
MNIDIDLARLEERVALLAKAKNIINKYWECLALQDDEHLRQLIYLDDKCERFTGLNPALYVSLAFNGKIYDNAKIYKF